MLDARRSPWVIGVNPRNGADRRRTEMIFSILPTPWVFNPAPSATLRRSAHHCAASTEAVQVPPARYAAILSDRHSPRASAEDRYRPILSCSRQENVMQITSRRQVRPLRTALSVPARMLDW